MITKAQIKLVRSLADKASRTAHGLFVAEGEKLVSEILSSDMDVETLLRVGDNISAGDMSRISHLKTPTDLLALVRIPPMRVGLDDISSGLSLLLDGVQDPGNMGTIIRLADWFGVGRIFCSDNSADCWSPKVVQATMGAIARVSVNYIPLESLLQGVPKGMPVYGTFLEGENIYGETLGADGLIVMGSEGRGVSPAVERYVTRKLYIPPYPATAATSESLNVATATAVTLAEFRRRML